MMKIEDEKYTPKWEVKEIKIFRADIDAPVTFERIYQNELGENAIFSFDDVKNEIEEQIEPVFEDINDNLDKTIDFDKYFNKDDIGYYLKCILKLIEIHEISRKSIIDICRITKMCPFSEHIIDNLLQMLIDEKKVRKKVQDKNITFCRINEN